MSRLSLVLLAILLAGCFHTPPNGPPDSPYDAECQALLDGGATFGSQCSSSTEKFVHNPTQDPKHCELTPACDDGEPPPQTGVACYLDGSGGVTAIEPKPEMEHRDAVLACAEKVSGCARGSACVINDWTQQTFQTAVIECLRNSGVCAGQHEPLHTDQISVATSQLTRVGSCNPVWFNYDVFAGDDSEGPLPPTGRRRTVVWATPQDVWRPVDVLHATKCDPTPQPPPPDPTPPPDTHGCADPLPPPIAQVHIKFWPVGPDWNLDSVARVCDAQYCEKVGFLNRECCPVRPEPCDGPGCVWKDREACEEYASQGDFAWLSDGPIEVNPDNKWRAFYDARKSTWIKLRVAGVESNVLTVQ